MRFKLILEVNKRAFGGMLPINYQYEQSAAIYKILSGADEAYASWLHDNGFRLESGKTFKLFVYSRFKIENFRILRDTERLQIFSDTVEWQVGFLPEKSTEKFIQGVFQDQVFEIGDTKSVVQFIVRSVEEYGVFIEIAPNLAGLAEADSTLRPGQAVSVYIKNILPEKMKIKLVVVNKNLSQPLRFEPHYFVTRGRIKKWIYSTPQSRKQIETIF